MEATYQGPTNMTVLKLRAASFAHVANQQKTRFRQQPFVDSDNRDEEDGGSSGSGVRSKKTTTGRDAAASDSATTTATTAEATRKRAISSFSHPRSRSTMNQSVATKIQTTRHRAGNMSFSHIDRKLMRRRAAFTPPRNNNHRHVTDIDSNSAVNGYSDDNERTLNDDDDDDEEDEESTSTLAPRHLRQSSSQLPPSLPTTTAAAATTSVLTFMLAIGQTRTCVGCAGVGLDDCSCGLPIWPVGAIDGADDSACGAGPRLRLDSHFGYVEDPLVPRPFLIRYGTNRCRPYQIVLEPTPTGTIGQLEAALGFAGPVLPVRGDIVVIANLSDANEAGAFNGAYVLVGLPWPGASSPSYVLERINVIEDDHHSVAADTCCRGEDMRHTRSIRVGDYVAIEQGTSTLIWLIESIDQCSMAWTFSPTNYSSIEPIVPLMLVCH